MSTFKQLLDSLDRGERFTARDVTAVVGLGHVGSAMAAALANSTSSDGFPRYNVLGFDLASADGQRKIDNLNGGVCPIPSEDANLDAAVRNGAERGNLAATSDLSYLADAATVVIDIPFNVADLYGDQPHLDWEPFRQSITGLAAHISEDTLVLVETTVPPGTCERLIWPIIEQSASDRGLDPGRIALAHSYERVMPGPNYLDSLINTPRVFAGRDARSSDACRAFLLSFLAVPNDALRQLGRIEASETSKVLENSYRAVNIAFIEEYGRFAEAIGIDLFEVIGVIRERPTHSNLRQPGLGVGGYCLTKDPLITSLSAKELYQLDLNFPFSEMAVARNKQMPMHAVARVHEQLGGQPGARVMICGAAYLAGVGDTRYSASEDLWRGLEDLGYDVSYHDPLVEEWREVGAKSAPEIDTSVDCIVLAVGHEDYRSREFAAALEAFSGVLVDTNNVLTATQVDTLTQLNKQLVIIGRGDIS